MTPFLSLGKFTEVNNFITGLPTEIITYFSNRTERIDRWPVSLYKNFVYVSQHEQEWKENNSEGKVITFY